MAGLFDEYGNPVSGATASGYGNLAGFAGATQGAANNLNPITSGGLMAGLSSLFGGNSLLGGTNPNGTQSMGALMPLLGIGSALMGGFQGAKKLSLAEDQLKEGKRQFNLNYDAQKQTTNTQLEDRQRARVASNAGAYESVSSYLDKNKVQ